MKYLVAVGVAFLLSQGTCSADRLVLAVPPIVREGRVYIPARLVFTVPPIVREGRAYVPARQFFEWWGGAIHWEGAAQALSLNWCGHEEKWSAASGALLVRDGKAYVRLRDVAEAFGERLVWRARDKTVHFGEKARSTYAAIPVGWTLPTMSRGLSRDQRQIWRAVMKTVPERSVDGMLFEIRRIRVVERWGYASIHPLNVVTDDAGMYLEKRGGNWQVLWGPGTDFGSDGRNCGIPGHVRLQLVRGD